MAEYLQLSKWWLTKMSNRTLTLGFLFCSHSDFFSVVKVIKAAGCLTLSQAYAEFTGMLLPRTDSNQPSGATCTLPLLSLIVPSSNTLARCQWPCRGKTNRLFSYFTKNVVFEWYWQQKTSKGCCTVDARMLLHITDGSSFSASLWLIACRNKCRGKVCRPLSKPQLCL